MVSWAGTCAEEFKAQRAWWFARPVAGEAWVQHFLEHQTITRPGCGVGRVGWVLGRVGWARGREGRVAPKLARFESIHLEAPQ